MRDEAEAEEVAAVRGCGGVTTGDAAEPRVVEPRAAAVYAAVASPTAVNPRFPVPWCIVVIAMPIVFAPFPYVPAHIV